ncbi:hypothetical protein C8Q80DRAFT_174230 [Daedaleopsis nitida]|nr:hypothetical protein C8Q80DRAFT_174230 [Daedaleopsis nitida]
MQDYKSSIVSDVRRCVAGVNDIVTLLLSDVPSTSDILDINYTQNTIDDFHTSRQAVVDSLVAASQRTERWLREAGDELSRNLSQAGRIEASIRQTSSDMHMASEHIHTSESRIRVLQSNIEHEENNLSSAQHALSNAREELESRERARAIMNAVTITTFFIFPIVGWAATAIGNAVMADSISTQQNAVSAAESQLSSTRAQLETQRGTLSCERAEKERLSSTAATLRRQADALCTDAERLKSARADLAELSTQINDCLYTVNGALSSSKTIAVMSSMRSVVAGIRGIVHALGRDAMFEGPLAELDDAALGALDRRVAAIRVLRLMV